MTIEAIITSLEELLATNKPLFIKGKPGDGKCNTLITLSNKNSFVYTEMYDNVSKELIKKIICSEKTHTQPTIYNFEITNHSDIEFFNSCLSDYQPSEFVKVIFTTSYNIVEFANCNVYDFPTITPTINTDKLAEIVASVLEIHPDPIKDSKANLELTMKELTNIVETCMFNKSLLA